MKNFEWHCDRCGKRTNPNHEDYVSVKSTRGGRGGMDLDFCSLRCLLSWAEQESLRIERYEQNSYYLHRYWSDGFRGSRFERETMDSPRPERALT